MEIVIKDWQSGIGASPHLGFDDMRNVDIHSSPGALLLALKSTKESASVVVDLPKWIVKNPALSDELFALGDAGNVYTSTNNGDTWTLVTGNTLTNANGNGLAIWKNYLMVARNSVIDWYGPLNGSRAWTSSWQTFTGTDNLFHPAIHAQDDILYIGDGRYVASIAEATPPFAPGTGASYTWSATALDLPTNYRIKCLAELGRNLMIGTWIGTSIDDHKIADIFPWDRASSSFNLPIRLGECGVNQMITKDGILYFRAGLKGNTYATTGGSATLLKTLQHQAGASITFNDFPGAISVQEGGILFGTSANGSVAAPCGTFFLRENALTMRSTISTGTSTSVSIGAVLSVDQETYLVGWKDGSTYGIDSVNISGYNADAFSGYVDTPMYHIGGPTKKISFSEAEFRMARTLATGESVRLAYRTQDTGSFTTLATVSNATHGAVSSYRLDASLADVESVQFRVSMSKSTDTSGTPRLLSITLR